MFTDIGQSDAEKTTIIQRQNSQEKLKRRELISNYFILHVILIVLSLNKVLNLHGHFIFCQVFSIHSIIHESLKSNQYVKLTLFRAFIFNHYKPYLE